jgi:hypothetical protein
MVSAEDLLPGVMQIESGGKADAVSPKGAVGLFQIMPGTGAMYGVPREALFHPEVNRMVATRYLDSLLQRYKGNVPMALAAYNTGPGNVDKGIFPAETRAYVRKVLSALGGKISSVLPESVTEEAKKIGGEVAPWAFRGEGPSPAPTPADAEEVDDRTPTGPDLLTQAFRRLSEVAAPRRPVRRTTWRA